MTSTFHGLETARRAMMTQQYALQTVGHNIANANTVGYTRQRVNLTPTEPYPNAGMNAPRIPGHIGTGVKAGSIQRVRDQFIDVQFRNEYNKFGYWDTRYKSLEKVEDILNEPSNEGLNNQIDEFWKALQELSLDPSDSGARRVVQQQAVAVAETFNHVHDSLTKIQNDYKNEIEVTEKNINTLLNELDNINQQIRETEPHGYVTNDLYDQQDNILDQLSQMMNIKVTREKSGGNANSVAEGAVTVTLINDSGQPMTDANGDPIVLVDGTGESAHKSLAVEFDEDNPFVSGFTFLDEDGEVAVDIDLDSMPRGVMKGLIQAYGYGDDADSVQGVLPDMISEINEMALVFATEINNVHQIGFTKPDINGNVELGGLFFDLSAMDGGAGAASAITIHDNIKNLDNIAASGVSLDHIVDGQKEVYQDLLNADRDEDYYDNIRSFLEDGSNFVNGQPVAYEGDATNASRLADIKDAALAFGDSSTTIGSFYQSVIGDMAVNTSEAKSMRDNSEGLMHSVGYHRDAISSVSLDEEMTLLIQFQHAYNAAARNITTIDEMLDRIINGMGIVGR
ncbi:flagellar hook-associated protein FlgK [Halalkalibacter sp. AB-rgal2]|uniref:flagellar hook-associated protein FlgK n=1 Tax=Halalkalibacter sp. AB-rgal2 TaxID=3242695 RepID=UPI00359E5160